MTNVVFVVPYALETSLRFVRATASLPGVRLALVSQEPAERFAPELGARLAAHVRVGDAHDTGQLAAAVHRLGRELDGPVHRLLGILEQLQEPLGAVREELRIRGMAQGTARNFRDKSRMKDLLRANDLPCAAHALAGSGPDALSAAERIGFPLVIKPPAGAGAKNTFRVDRREDLESYLRTMPPHADDPLLLEEFIVGEEHSFDSVSLGGKHVFHSISEYYPTPLEVMQTPWIQWCVLLPRTIDTPAFHDILRVGPRVLDVLGMVTGLTHMEWFRKRDGSIAISEVGARPPGAQFTTLLSYAHDRDFYRAWAELMVHERFAPPARDYAAGAVFLRGQGEGQVREVRGLDELRRELGPLVVEARIPKVGQPRASSYEGEGFVILRHTDTEVVKRGLRRVLEVLRIELG